MIISYNQFRPPYTFARHCPHVSAWRTNNQRAMNNGREQTKGMGPQKEGKGLCRDNGTASARIRYENEN